MILIHWEARCPRNSKRYLNKKESNMGKDITINKEYKRRGYPSSVEKEIRIRSIHSSNKNYGMITNNLKQFSRGE